MFMFTPKFGEMIQFDEHIFQLGWNHQMAIEIEWENRAPCFSLLDGIGDDFPTVF